MGYAQALQGNHADFFDKNREVNALFTVYFFISQDKNGRIELKDSGLNKR